MKVEKDKVVSLTYELHLDGPKGEFIEKVETDQPLNYIHGAGMLLPQFEEKVEGLKTGEDFNFLLEKAYGEFKDNAVVEMPKTIFEQGGPEAMKMMEVGNMVPFQGEQGNQLLGKILEIMDDKVKIDFNHPLAEKDLHYTGKVVEVREATPEEISHGHVHGPGGHEH